MARKRKKSWWDWEDWHPQGGAYLTGCSFHMGDCGGVIHIYRGPFQGMQFGLCDNHTNRLCPEWFNFEVVDDPVEEETTPVAQVP
jgi:hypothetical protein